MILPTRASQHQNARTPRRNEIADSAVVTTDFADNTDREGIAVQWVFARRAVANSNSHYGHVSPNPKPEIRNPKAIRKQNRMPAKHAK